MPVPNVPDMSSRERSWTRYRWSWLALSTVPLTAGALRLVQRRRAASALIPANDPPRRLPAHTLVVRTSWAATVYVTSWGSWQLVPRFRQAGTGSRRQCPAQRRHRVLRGGRSPGRAVRPLDRRSSTRRSPAPVSCSSCSASVFGSAMVGCLALALSPLYARRRHRGPPGVDDPGLRDRPCRRHPGLHRGHRRGTLRDRACWLADLAKGAWLGDQPGRAPSGPSAVLPTAAAEHLHTPATQEALP